MPKVSAPVTSVKESSLDIDVQVALIPLGLAAVEDLLQQEVRQLAGTRYARKTADISCLAGTSNPVRCIWPTSNFPYRCLGCAT